MDALQVGYQGVFQKAFQAAEPQWPSVAMEVRSTTAEEKYGWLGEFASMKEWIGDRQVKNIAASDYAIKNKDYEASVEVKRTDIEDDKIGLYNPLFSEMGRSARVHADESVFTLLKNGFTLKSYDGVAYFSASHKVGGVSYSNLGSGSGSPWFLLDVSRAVKPLILQTRQAARFAGLTDPNSEHVFMRNKYIYGCDARDNVGYGFWQMAYGSKGDLTAANYKVARAKIAAVKSDEGKPLGLMGTLLVVDPSNEGAAREILLAERDASGATNIWQNSAKLLVSAYLS